MNETEGTKPVGLDDFDKWWKEAEDLRDQLTKREAELTAELWVVQNRLTRITEVLNTKNVKDLGKTKKTRPKIRPLLKEKIKKSSGAGYSHEGLIADTAKELGVDESSVSAALDRWVKSNPNLTIEEVDGIETVKLS